MKFQLITRLIIVAFVLPACGGGGSSSSEPVSPPPPPPPDVTAPVITLVGDNPQIVITGNAYVELGATASDNIDGDLTASIIIDATAVDSAIPGNYTVTYDVTDAAGNAADTVSRTVTVSNLPTEPVLSASAEIKKINFSWTASQDAEYYRLLENSDGHSGFSQIGEDLLAGSEQLSINISPYAFDFANAQYVVEACNSVGCSSSSVVTVLDLMIDTIVYIKASNTEWHSQYQGENFGWAIAISSNGQTVAISAPEEDSASTGINGDQGNYGSLNAGAVYIFRQGGDGWYQEAYVKASITGLGHLFGKSLALSHDGTVLAVGAPGEDIMSSEVNGVILDNPIEISTGAVYLYRFDGTNWQQEARIQAAMADFNGEAFGQSVSISHDAQTLAVGASGERSSSAGVNGDQADNTLEGAGAVFVFGYDGVEWVQDTYIKSSSPGYLDRFGGSVAINADGTVLVVGAKWEDSAAIGINGDDGNDLAEWSGAAYVFRKVDEVWEQEAYLKASNAEANDQFGYSVAISADGAVIAVGALWESGGIGGINVDGADNSAGRSGAVYVFNHAGSIWSQGAYIKASNPAGPGAWFGAGLALGSDGNALVVGAPLGISEDPNGAAYMFRFDGINWYQESHIKTPNLGINGGDWFGFSVAISGGSQSIAIGAIREDSSTTGINSEPNNSSTNYYYDQNLNAGAVYVY